MTAYAVRIEEVVDRFVPYITASVEDSSRLREPPGAVSLLLKKLAKGVVTNAADDTVRHDLRSAHDQFSDAGIQAGLIASSFLLSQLYVERELPLEGMAWNQEAERTLNGGLPLLARAAVLSQRLSIRLQQHRLGEAEKLAHKLSQIELSAIERGFVSPPVNQLRISLAYESGTPLEELEATLSFAEPTYSCLLRGRLLIQNGRYTAALAEFRRGLERLGGNGRDTGSLRRVLTLHEARALYFNNSVAEARKLYAELLRALPENAYFKLRLAAEVGLGQTCRVLGGEANYTESRRYFQGVIEKAEELGFAKTKYQGLMGMADLERDEGNYTEARKLLHSASASLKEYDRKERCTLHRRQAELEYRLDHGDAGRHYYRKAIRLLGEGKPEEAALLHASRLLEDAELALRGARVPEALNALGEGVELLRRNIFSVPTSVYGVEIGPRFLVGKLLRTQAQAELLSGNPDGALKASSRAMGYVNASVDAEGRSRSKLLFVEAIAFGTLGDGRACLDRLDGVERTASDLGIIDPISQYLYELKAVVSEGGASEIAFNLCRSFMRSEVAEGFRRYEPMFLAVVWPSSGLEFAERRENVDEMERSALKGFAEEYKERLTSALSRESRVVDEDLAGFLEDFAARYEEAADAEKAVRGDRRYLREDEEKLQRVRGIWTIVQRERIRIQTR